MPGNVIFSGSLPGNACSYITDEASRFALYLSSMVGIAPSSAGVYVGTSPPADHSLVWLKLDPTSNYPVRFYFYYGGWCSPHPMAPGQTIILTKSSGVALSNLPDYDGGNGNTNPTISPVSGAMWQLNPDMHYTPPDVTNMVARFPLGIGVLPNVTDSTGAASPVTLTMTSPDGGTDTILQTIASMTPHTHFISVGGVPGGVGIAGDSLTAYNQLARYNNPDGALSTDYQLEGNTGTANVGLTSSAGGSGSPSPLGAYLQNTQNILPPYAPVMFVQRTGRLFYYQAG